MHSAVEDIKFGMFCFCQETSNKNAQFQKEPEHQTKMWSTQNTMSTQGLQATDSCPDLKWEEMSSLAHWQATPKIEVPLYERSYRNIHKYTCKHFRHELELEISVIVKKKKSKKNKKKKHTHSSQHASSQVICVFSGSQNNCLLANQKIVRQETQQLDLEEVCLRMDFFKRQLSWSKRNLQRCGERF